MARSTPRSPLIALVAAIAGAALALGGIVTIQLGAMQPMAGFAIFALGSILGGLAALLFGVVGMLRSRGDFSSQRRLQARVATVLGLLLLLGVGWGASPGQGLPRINDITTDLVDPPTFSAATLSARGANGALPYPEGFAAQVRAAYPDLQPIRTGFDRDRAYAAAVASARALGWILTHRDPASRTFDATDTTRIFRFVDDIAVRVRSDGEGARIDIRSKSRDGQGDLGANANRIRRFAAELQRAAAAPPSPAPSAAH